MRSWMLVALIVSATTTTAFAQLSPDLATSIRELGTTIKPPETGKLFAPLQAKEPYADAIVERDLKYGPDERNLLDVFKAKGSDNPKPVLIFLHGGGYQRGNKRTGTSPYYDNVMLWAVANGMVGVNMTYRLAPAATWPSGADDVAAAVTWVKANIAKYGGDGNRIYLFGHSAGASHVGSFLARDGHPQVRGAILASGTYALDPSTNDPGERAYFGADTSLWQDRSSINGLAKSSVPLLIVRAELDVPYYARQTDTLKAKLCEQNRCPTYLVLKGHSHMSEIYAINTSDTSFTRAIADFVAKTR